MNLLGEGGVWQYPILPNLKERKGKWICLHWQSYNHESSLCLDIERTVRGRFMTMPVFFVLFCFWRISVSMLLTQCYCPSKFCVVKWKSFISPSIPCGLLCLGKAQLLPLWQKGLLWDSLGAFIFFSGWRREDKHSVSLRKISTQ